MVHFDECEHKWEFHLNADNSYAKGVSFYRCKKCEEIITLQEKCALEQTIALKESLKIQERSLRIAMWAMISGIVSGFIALCVFLFGDKTLFL